MAVEELPEYKDMLQPQQDPQSDWPSIHPTQQQPLPEPTWQQMTKEIENLPSHTEQPDLAEILETVKQILEKVNAMSDTMAANDTKTSTWG